MQLRLYVRYHNARNSENGNRRSRENPNLLDTWVGYAELYLMHLCGIYEWLGRS